MQINKFHLLTLTCALIVAPQVRPATDELSVCTNEVSCNVDEQEQLASLEKALIALLAEEEKVEAQKRFKEINAELKAKKSPSALFLLGEYSACLLLVYVYFTHIQPWIKAKYPSDAAAKLGEYIILAPFAKVLKDTSEYGYSKGKAYLAEVA